MLKSDFHVHTVLSRHYILDRIKLADGLNTPEEMVRAAKRKGLNCIAITDHNVLFDYSIAKKLSKKYDIVVLPGIEMYLNGKEALAIGIEKVPNIKNLEELKENVHEQGGVLIAPHPYDPFGRGFKNFEYFDGIEVINGFSTFGFKKLAKIADRMKKAKICGSDAHSTNQLGWVYCLVDASPDIDSIITAIKKRKVKPLYKKIPKYIQVWYYFQKYALGKAIFKYENIHNPTKIFY